MLTVVVPVFNEEKTVLQLLERVRTEPIEKEIIVVDDGSTDGTSALLSEYAARVPIVTLMTHGRNRGKGAAIRTALPLVSGRIVLIQDADLEYDPSVYQHLLAPILDGRADVVYGSRFTGGDAHRVLYFWHYAGNRFLTMVSNMFTNLNLSDMETGHKAFRSEIIKSLQLREDRFGFEPEVTAKIAKMQCRIYEVGIAYSGRTYAEGKKIMWWDGLSALCCIIRYNLLW